VREACSTASSTCHTLFSALRSGGPRGLQAAWTRLTRDVYGWLLNVGTHFSGVNLHLLQVMLIEEAIERLQRRYGLFDYDFCWFA
jgi:hypothetical protein